MCCLPEMTLLDKDNDKTLGTIKLNCNLCPQIDISVYDEDNDIRFNIKSDCCPTAMVCKGTICGLCCQELEIPVYNESGKECAYIKKKFRSCGAGFTDADTFLCKFKDDGLSTREKALLMGACFMIDFC